MNRDFARSEPSRLWLTDITEHRTREGKVYCAVVLDAFSRRVVGWSIDSSQTSNLVVNALGTAIENRQAEGVVIHSDHGTQFTSWAFTCRALDSGLVPSMGSIGDCYDNGQMESFWSRMQVELLNRKRWNTRLEVTAAGSSTRRTQRWTPTAPGTMSSPVAPRLPTVQSPRTVFWG